MAYSWDNRVAFIVRFLYDIDNNGYLDAHDFECLAVRTCVLEGRGDCGSTRLARYQHIMLSLWEEIAEIADFDKLSKTDSAIYICQSHTNRECTVTLQPNEVFQRAYLDGKITVEEFKIAVQNCCVGKKYDEFPQAMRAFIEANFRLIDLNQDGVLDIDEFRYDCVQRIPVDDIHIINDAYYNLLNDEDRKRGGLTLARYQELFALFLGDQREVNPSMFLFGPLVIADFDC